MIHASPFCGKCGAFMHTVMKRGKVVLRCRRCRPTTEPPAPPPCKATGRCEPEHCADALTCKEGRK